MTPKSEPNTIGDESSQNSNICVAKMKHTRQQQETSMSRPVDDETVSDDDGVEEEAKHTQQEGKIQLFKTKYKI